MKGARPDFRRYVLVNIFVGTTVTYLGGVLQMMAVMDLSFGKVMVMAVLPYIPGDIMKDIVAAFLGVKVNQVLQARR
jgi:biotin transport system substrate-specific component